jgi:hypothetical protein
MFCLLREVRHKCQAFSAGSMFVFAASAKLLHLEWKFNKCPNKMWHSRLVACEGTYPVLHEYLMGSGELLLMLTTTDLLH